MTRPCGSAARRRWRRDDGDVRVRGALAATVAAVAVLAGGCGTVGTFPAAEPSVVATTSAATTAPARAEPSPPTAADSLAPFFSAASEADTRIRTAAELVNAHVGVTTAEFDQDVRAAVMAMDPRPVAAAIPVGLPPDLMRSVLLVLNDLVARSAAFNRVATTSGPVVLDSQDGADLLHCLGGGAAIAARFPQDLAAARALAAQLPAVTAAPVDSRQGAELAVRVYDLVLENNGCDGCGGQVHDGLWPMAWDGDPSAWFAAEGRWDYYGTIRTIPFRAVYAPTQDGNQPLSNGWIVQLLAC